jgi:hypothetical protein
MKFQVLKKEANRLLGMLPKDADWEDLLYLISVRKKIDVGQRDGEAGRVFTLEQIRKSPRIVR